MERDWVNIRFGSRHLHIGPWHVRWTHNHFHDRARFEEPDWKWFEVYMP